MKDSDKIFCQTLCGGFDSNFTYLIGCHHSKELALIDCSVEWSQISAAIKNAQSQLGFTGLSKIFITHSHFDHVLTLKEACTHTDAKVYAHPLVERKINVPLDFYVEDNAELELGLERIRAIYTPGHLPDCVCYIWHNRIFTGDTLFVEAAGRCDFPESDPQQQLRSLAYIANDLPPSMQVYPGHDYGSIPVSTIQHEREHNPYLKALLR